MEVDEDEKEKKKHEESAKALSTCADNWCNVNMRINITWTESFAFVCKLNFIQSHFAFFSSLSLYSLHVCHVEFAHVSYVYVAAKKLY